MGTPNKVDPGRLRELHAAGRTDAEIMAALGLARVTVRKWRGRLGLPAHGQGGAPARARKATRLCEQLSRLGVPHLRAANPHDHAAAAARLAAGYGLPADLFPAQVRILLALAGGPAATGALADAAGRGPNRNPHHRFNYRACPGRNYLTDLCRRGLVARAPGPKSRPGPGRGESVYFLSPAAIDLLAGAGREA